MSRYVGASGNQVPRMKKKLSDILSQVGYPSWDETGNLLINYF